ncbi:hypothetical protein MVEN_00120000 [Mycena venus]|uniref:Uncharacterized protein n=1 Tax=Mycena venus TaxID=2733690 RepID=A0A8H6Z4T0_9AGAR|nr:hypothetical protein MVEN_00120000 [Mycena venus]
MSSAHATTNPETGDASVDASRPFSFIQKPIAVSADFTEQGLQVFNQEQGTSASAPPATRNVRKDGGIPSSPAFAAEQAKDAQRFAALNLETRDQSVSLSSQMKRDFLLAQSAPSVPPGFATAPSNATRPISRSASMAGEVVDSPAEVVADDGDATPLILANHKEVSKLLHLAGPPTAKAGQKEKAETALAAAARANGNITRLGGKIIALEARVEKHELLTDSHSRACQSRHRSVNLGKLEDKIDVVGVESRNGIENLEARIKLLATGASSDARISLHTSQIAQLTDSLDTIKRTLERLTTAFLCDDDGVPVKHFATKGDIGGLWDSIQESFDGLDQLVDERLAPTIQKVGGAADLVAKLEAQVAKLETHDAKRQHELLAARENIARLQIDLAASLTGSAPAASTGVAPSTVTAPALAIAAPPPAEVRPATFSVGGKKLKRKASVELIAGPVKRANARPDKSTYHHWTRVSPVNPDTKNAPPLLFKKLLEAAAIKDYSLPAVYIERATGEPSVLNVGFTSAGDANGFVTAWSGATFQMPVGLRGITAQHIAVADRAGSRLRTDIPGI